MLLTGGELEGRLDELFVPGTARPEQVRGTKYELRLATDYLIGPDERFYTPESPLEDYLLMAAGGVAFVSTVEQFTMPWNVVGRTGVKYGLVTTGLIALVGSTVDPGYGLPLPDGTPEPNPEPGERLYFLLTNFSSNKIRLFPGNAVLTVEFEAFDRELRDAERSRLSDSLQRGRQTRKALREGRDLRVALSFLPDLRTTEAKVDQLTERVEWIVLLGMLVVLSALLALAMDGLIQTLKTDDFAVALDHAGAIPDDIWAALAIASTLITPVVLAFLLLRYLFRRIGRRPGAPIVSLRPLSRRTRLRLWAAQRRERIRA